MGLLLEAECEIAAGVKEWEGVGELGERARAEAERCGLDALQCAVDRLQGHRALQSGHVGTAVRLLDRARAGFEQLDARWDEAVTALLLGQAFAEAGEAGRVREVVVPAIDVFRELGATMELAQAQSLIERFGGNGS